MALVVAWGAVACGTAGRDTATSTSTAPSTSAETTPTSRVPVDAETEAEMLAADAYVWGSPIVVSMRTLQTFGELIGVNRLFSQQELTGPTARLVVAPNVDTLYSVAVLDLRGGPLALSIPAVRDRYYTYQFLDVFTESFAYVGTRATGGDAGTWLIVPPDWTEPAPAGMEIVRASTPQAFLLGRFLVTGPDDLAVARAAMAQVRLESLASIEGRAEAALPALGAPAGTPQAVAALDASFFDELGDALAINPPTAASDRSALDRFAKIGVGEGLHPAADARDDEARAVLERGAAMGSARVDAFVRDTTAAINGWESREHLGRYGDDFDSRAAVARSAWGANIPEEAVYLRSMIDSDGDRYSGARDYRLHFDADEVPPARAFWSLTVYGDDMFLVEHASGRYAIGDRTEGLRTNADGSIDLLLSAGAPSREPANWLPVPDGPFTLVLRIYLPGAAVLAGSYRVPGVEAIG